MSLDKPTLLQIINGDVDTLIKKNDPETGYADSWKKRGGIGAFMMLARKWDRIETAARSRGWDIFQAIRDDHRVDDGILDDIRDLRAYLILVEHEALTALIPNRDMVARSEEEMRRRDEG